MKIKNKELIQSYVLTSAKYKFSVYEKRVLYRIIEIAQQQLEGQNLNEGFTINQTLFGDYVIRMPLTAFEKGGSYNTPKIKQALKDLRRKDITFENEFVEEIYGLIESPKFYKPVDPQKKSNDGGVIEKPRINLSGDPIEDIPPGTVEFRVNPKIYQAAMNFSKGWRKYELKVALSLESTYAMRMYELVSRQKTPITFLISDLREMWGIESKYKETKDFFKRTIDKAKSELDKKSPWSFTYKKGKTGNKFTSVTFFPKHLPENEDQELVKKQTQKQTSIRWDLNKEFITYLKSKFDFNEGEIHRNRDTFIRCQNEIEDPLVWMNSVKGRSRTKSNPKGYLIKSIQLELEE